MTSSTVVVTWMDGTQESYPLGNGDTVRVARGVLSITRGRYPARDDRELSKNIPLENVRIYNVYE